MRAFEEIAFIFIMTVVLVAVAWVGCSSVQEAHDTSPTRYIVERDTVF